jgi:hypothetical protein
MKADSNVTVTPPVVVTPPPAVVFDADLLWTATDPFPFLTESPFPDYPSYNTTVSLPEGRDILFPLTGLPAERYLVVRYPDTESVKTQWYHDIFNYGPIEDSVFREIFTNGGFSYIMTRNPVTFDPGKTLKFT